MVNCIVVAIIVLIHYEVLYRLTRLLPTLAIQHRFRIAIGVAGSLVAPVVEIWVFAFAYFLMVSVLGWGSFDGNFHGGILDCFYVSFTTYITLGFGDIQPFGEVRYESFAGLLLITWTASFLYLEMQNFWNND